MKIDDIRSKVRSLSHADRDRAAREAEHRMGAGRHPSRHSEGEKKGSEGHGGYLVTENGKGHLPVERDGKFDPHLAGAAKAALTVGYRGNKYQGPGKEQALSKLKRLYKEHGLKWD